MIKKIGLISSIKETYNDQFEFSYDIKINKFIRSIYRKVEISNLDFHSNIDKDFNLIIICGGNDLPLIKKINRIQLDINSPIIYSNKL